MAELVLLNAHMMQTRQSVQTVPAISGREIQEMRIRHHSMDMIEKEASHVNTCGILKSPSLSGTHISPKQSGVAMVTQ